MRIVVLLLINDLGPTYLEVVPMPLHGVTVLCIRSSVEGPGGNGVLEDFVEDQQIHVVLPGRLALSLRHKSTC